MHLLQELFTKVELEKWTILFVVGMVGKAVFNFLGREADKEAKLLRKKLIKRHVAHGHSGRFVGCKTCLHVKQVAHLRVQQDLVQVEQLQQ